VLEPAPTAPDRAAYPELMAESDKEAKIRMVFEKFDRDKDGYHNLKESQALGRALEGITGVDHDVSEDDFAGLCADLGAQVKRGLNLSQFTRMYTDPAFGAKIERDYRKIFGSAPPTKRVVAEPAPARTPRTQTAASLNMDGYSGSEAVEALVAHHRSRPTQSRSPAAERESLLKQNAPLMGQRDLLKYVLALRAEIETLTAERAEARNSLAAERAWGNDLVLTASSHARTHAAANEELAAQVAALTSQVEEQQKAAEHELAEERKRSAGAEAKLKKGLEATIAKLTATNERLVEEMQGLKAHQRSSSGSNGSSSSAKQREQPAEKRKRKQQSTQSSSQASEKPETESLRTTTSGIQATQNACRAIFEKFDRDKDGYHNLKESQALGRALEGITGVDHDVSEDDFAGLCADLGAQVKRGLNLSQFTRMYTDPAFGAKIERDYRKIFGSAPPTK
jgi:Ca2+-binding EF-hand superfamily protein